VEIPFISKKKVITLSKKLRKFEMIKVLENLSWVQLEKIETNMINFPGVHLFSSKKRFYPYNNYFTHIVGYTSKPSKKDLALPFISSMPTLDIGKTGIEKTFNKDLIGIPGSREIETNAIGREIRQISIKPGTNGKKIELSVDLSIQETIHKRLIKEKSGSVVVMNIETGEIIGMVSIPDFDPNKIINKPNDKYWNEVSNNQLAPLTNRSIQGLYAPGSTFKMIVALTALEKGIINKDSSIFCNGSIEFGDRIFHCWKTKGHGKVNLMKGIVESCDCFFYDLGTKLKIDDIKKMSNKLGLGNLTNLELPSEKKGIIPSTKWKKEKIKKDWYAGETLNACIGQGYLLCTPLQLAYMTSLIANGGKKIKPTLLKVKESKISKQKEITQLEINKSHINFIKKAMHNVVNESRGTAYRSRSNSSDYIFAGKTGTSQVKKISIEERESEDFRKKEILWKNRDHALFVGYMPISKPKYSISVIIEHGGSGSSAAAPIAKDVFNKIFELGI